MIKIYENQRAAISSNGWLTLIVDPLNWIFNIYVGGEADIDVLADKFKNHLVEAADFVDDVKMVPRYADEELKDKGATSGSNWLRKRLKKCPEFVRGNRAGGITLLNDNGPIVILVPGFEMDDPHYLSVLAHELIHATFEFAYNALHVEECGGNEFFACTHTTLFERTLNIIKDFKVNIERADESSIADDYLKKEMEMIEKVTDCAKRGTKFTCYHGVLCEKIVDGEHLAHEMDDTVIEIGNLDLTENFIYAKDAQNNMYRFVVGSFMRYIGARMIVFHSPPAKLIQDAAKSAAGFKHPVQEGMPLAINKWAVNMIACQDVPNKEFPYKIYLMKSPDVADLYQLVISDGNISETRHYVLMCNFKIGEMFPNLELIIKTHSPTDEVQLYAGLNAEIVDVFGAELIHEACEKYRFCFASEKELDTIKSKYHRGDVYKFKKGTTFTDRSRDAYVSLNEDTMLMISCFHGLSGFSGRCVKLITSADDEYEVSLVEFDRFVRDGAATFCVPNKNLKECDGFHIGDKFVFRKGVHLHISSDTKNSETELAHERTLIIRSIEGEWIFLDDVDTELGFRIEAKELHKYYDRNEVISVGSACAIGVGTIFICKEELKKEDLPGLEYNFGKGVQFEITSMSPDIKWCDIRAGSYEASGFNVARIEKLLNDDVIVKKTQSN